MANYYNPAQNKTTIPGRATQPGGVNPAQTRTSQYMHLIRDPQWASGLSFQGQSRDTALANMIGAQSSANPEDYAAMDEMRNYYRGALADLPGNTAQNISSFDTQSQYGLKNLLSQYKNANSGRGTLGSRQYAGAQGDIMSRSNADYISGLLKARSDAVDQAGKIGAGLTGVQNQDLAERNFQQGQAMDLSNLITQWMNQDQGREASLMQAQGQKDAANKAMWGSIISGLAMAGGSALGPGGALAGKVVADQVVK